MTQIHASGPDSVPPFGAMLHGAVIPIACSTPVIVLMFWITRQARGGLAALLGVVIAVLFFTSGLYVMKRVTNSNPLTIMAGALAVFFGQVIFLGFVILAFKDADWLDGRSFGLAVLAVSLIWQVTQVAVFTRLRKPVYDQPADEPAVEPADKPASAALPGQESGMSR